MQKLTVRIFAVLITLLAVGGLFEDDHLLGVMNADAFLDILRIALAALLLYVGFRPVSGKVVRGSLLLVGALYVGMAIFGAVDSTLWGLLPNGLTSFDVVFHLATGAVALGVAARSSDD